MIGGNKSGAPNAKVVYYADSTTTYGGSYDTWTNLHIDNGSTDDVYIEMGRRIAFYGLKAANVDIRDQGNVFVGVMVSADFDIDHTGSGTIISNSPVLGDITLAANTRCYISNIDYAGAITLGAGSTLIQNGVFNFASLSKDASAQIILTSAKFMNSGTGTVTAGNTSIVITHGLAITPTLANIDLTPQDNLSGRNIWVSTPTSTQFTIHLSSADAINHVIGWSYNE